MASLLDLPNELLLDIFELISPNMDDLLRLFHVNTRFRSVLVNSKYIKRLHIPSYWPARKTAAFLRSPLVAQTVETLDIRSPPSAFSWDDHLRTYNTPLIRMPSTITTDELLTVVSILPSDLDLPSLKSLSFSSELAPTDVKRIASLCPSLTQLHLHQFVDTSIWKGIKSLLKKIPGLQLNMAQVSTSVTNKLAVDHTISSTFPLVLFSKETKYDYKLQTGVNVKRFVHDGLSIIEKFPSITKLVLQNQHLEFNVLQKCLRQLTHLKGLVLDNCTFSESPYSELETTIEQLLLSCPLLESLERRSPRPIIRCGTGRRMQYMAYKTRRCSLADMFVGSVFQNTENTREMKPTAFMDDTTHKETRHIKLKELKLVCCESETIQKMLELVNGTGILETLQIQFCERNVLHTTQCLLDLHPSTWKNLRHFTIDKGYGDYNSYTLIQPLMRHFLALLVPLETLVLPRLPDPGSLGPIPTLNTLELRLDVDENEDWLRPIIQIANLYPKLQALRLDVRVKEREWEDLLLLCKSFKWLHTISVVCVRLDEVLEPARKVHGNWLGSCYRHRDHLFITFCPVAFREDQQSEETLQQTSDAARASSSVM